jgi:hypothetical protein
MVKAKVKVNTKTKIKIYHNSNLTMLNERQVAFILFIL